MLKNVPFAFQIVLFLFSLLFIAPLSFFCGTLYIKFSVFCRFFQSLKNFRHGKSSFPRDSNWHRKGLWDILLHSDTGGSGLRDLSIIFGVREGCLNDACKFIYGSSGGVELAKRKCITLLDGHLNGVCAPELSRKKKDFCIIALT